MGRGRGGRCEFWGLGGGCDWERNGERVLLEGRRWFEHWALHCGLGMGGVTRYCFVKPGLKRQIHRISLCGKSMTVDKSNSHCFEDGNLSDIVAWR